MATTDVELFMFAFSHYNEKARWSLDWKAIPHVRTRLLPGPHARVVQKLIPSGSTTVPLVRFGGDTVQGSAEIIAELERRHPEKPLYPADPALRERALGIQRHFDEEVGPLVRRALFSVMLSEPGYICRMFAGHRSLPVRTAYRATLPLVGSVMRKSMGITDAASIEAAFEGTRAGLEYVAKELGSSGYLAGDAFSVADLTACALLAPCCQVEHPDMRKPEPMPDAIQQWLARWSEHPTIQWVQERYRTDRPASAEMG